MLSPLLNDEAASVISLAAWPWLSPISSMFSLLPPMCFLFTSSTQDTNGRWFFFFGFKVFSLEPFSHSTWSASQTSSLNYLNFSFWNWKPCRPAFILLKLNQFVENRLELSDHKQLLLQHPHYLPKVYHRITSRLLSAYFVKKSVGYYIPDLQGPAVSIYSSFYIWNLRLRYQPIPRSISFSL